jgi:hypothetical protein
MATMMTKTIPRADLARPAWAKAAILASYEEDHCDPMTDYFAVHRTRTVFLAWSAHTRDLFPELRKAAATFAETAHLGPGKDRYTARVVVAADILDNGTAYWKGTPSPWHTDLYGGQDAPTFTTLAEAEAFTASKGAPHDIWFGETRGTFEWSIGKTSIEHREKYSMGHGYYLKASGTYSSGWTVYKRTGLTYLPDPIEVLDTPADAPAAPDAEPAGSPDGVTMTMNAAKNGVELRFPAKPSEAVRSTLKAHGWRWSRFAFCWYHRDTPDARAFATSLTAGGAGTPPPTDIDTWQALRGRTL